jgi:hypothetical protein
MKHLTPVGLSSVTKTVCQLSRTIRQPRLQRLLTACGLVSNVELLVERSTISCKASPTMASFRDNIDIVVSSRSRVVAIHGVRYTCTASVL